MINKKIIVQTQEHTEVVNITEQLADLVKEVQEGLALFYAPHTTVALLICEDDDELRRDLVQVAETLLAPLRPFEHIRNNNPNAEAHLISALGGTSLMVPILDGKLDLGTYQNILLLEMDGPKSRQIKCSLISS